MIKKLILMLSLSFGLYSHELMLFVEDNKDNTITVAGEFDTGDDAAGALVKIESLVSGNVLFQQRLPKESEITIDIPKEPYQVVLDGGSGHTLVKEGIAPIEGYSEELKAQSKQVTVPQNVSHEWSSVTIVFFSICIILFLMTIYFSNKNTNRILNQLKES
ncbi:hypothetical protein ACNSOS_05035 [Aliarcobacter vitoriensis]|uniref:hypothetical protein n=1 Tax=Aliarcobacter vitoriensis TaxID=2011099 RepID=UPI003AAC396D